MKTQLKRFTRKNGSEIIAESDTMTIRELVEANKRNLKDLFLIDADLSGLCLTDVDLSDAVLLNVNLDNVRFLRVNMSNSTISNTSNREIEGARFLNVNMRETEYNCCFIDCEFDQVDFSNTFTPTLDFKRCNHENVTFNTEIGFVLSKLLTIFK